MSSQLVAFNPKTRVSVRLVKGQERRKGTSTVFNGADGVVYGQFHSTGFWYTLSKGKATPVQVLAKDRAPIKAGSRETVLPLFPYGSKIKEINVPEGWVDIMGNAGAVRRVKFEYPSEGVDIVSILLGPVTGYTAVLATR